MTAACAAGWCRFFSPVLGGLPEGFSPNGCLDFLNAMATITDILEFTARLAQRGDFGQSVSLTVQMIGVKNRLLTSLEPLRSWIEFCPSSEEILGRAWVLNSTELIADPAAKALEILFWFYERFQWRDPPADIILREQRKFLGSK